jgi:hypothetical protein
MDPLVKRWVETWLRAGPELEAIRRAELQSVDTREAVRQLFELRPPSEPALPWSGLVEQQRWFARLSRRYR